MHLLNLFRILILCIAWCSISLAATSLPLPVERAFILETNLDQATHTLWVQWQITPGYYLYAKRMHININPAAEQTIQLPQGELKYINDHQEEVFLEKVSVPILLNKNASEFKLNIQYQGCSAEGFCYPPIHKDLNIDTNKNNISMQIGEKKPPAIIAWKWSGLLTDQNQINSVLQAEHFSILLLLFLGLGVLLAFTPCVFPMIPILTSLILNESQTKNKQQTLNAFLLTSSYVLGMALAYAAAGFIVATLGQSIQIYLQQPLVIIMTSLLFILLAGSLFGFYQLQLPQRLQQIIYGLNQQQSGGTYGGAFLMGIIATLIVSPCVTAPLVGVLMYIAQTGDQLLGATALFMMGLGMGLPLLLIGTSVGQFLPKSGPWLSSIKYLLGLIMMGMALWLMSRFFSATVNTILCGFLIAIAIGILLLPILNRLTMEKQWRTRLIVLFGLCSTLGIFSGTLYLPAQSNSLQFAVITQLKEVQQALILAKTKHQPILLDFYADWCESCIVMDKKVFNNRSVKEALSSYILLRVDLTQNTAHDRDLMKAYNVIAPPTILLFDVNGQEKVAHRIVGEMSAKQFLKALS